MCDLMGIVLKLDFGAWEWKRVRRRAQQGAASRAQQAGPSLGFEYSGLTDVGVKELAGRLRELPALTHVNLARNAPSAQGKSAITRACRCRPSSMRAMYV